jgi:hypothetical protein
MLNRFRRMFRSCGASSCVAALLALCCVHTAMAAVPAAVSNQTTKYATGMKAPAKVAVDGSGNVFVVDNGAGSLLEIPAGTTTPITVLTGLGGPYGVAVDSSGDVIVGASYNGHVYFLANQNGTLCTTCGANSGPLDLTSAYGFGGLDGYYAAPSDVAVDQNGVVYIAVSYCSSCSGKYDIFTVQTQGPATTPASIAVKGSAALFISGLAAYPLNMAVDAFGHLYWADGTNVYGVSTTSGVNPTPTVVTTGFTKPYGATTDAGGNLYITDYGTHLLTIVPREGTALAATDKYVAGNITNLQYGVGLDVAGNVYYGDGYATGSVNKTVLGAASLGSSNVGTASANATLSYYFNSAVTATSIVAYQGNSVSTAFKITGGTCAALIPYVAGQTCTVQASFTPASTGARSGSIVFLTGTKPVNTSYLGGIGVGAAMTVDPGTQTALTGQTAWVSPSAVAIGPAGNYYVADAGSNVVQVISAAGTATATIGSGLNAPGGVAADGAGNVFIADTKNNRVVEVPNEGGTLNTSDQTVIPTTGLSAPIGIAVDTLGGLYVADSGNARVVHLTSFAGTAVAVQTVVASGLKTPVAVALDGAGDLYVADKGANLILKVNPVSSVATAVLSGSSVNAPVGVAVGASGGLYVVNSGNNSVLRIPSVSGVPSPTGQLALGTGLVAPSGIAVTGSGNVAITDSTGKNAYMLQRTAGTLNFGKVNYQASSTVQAITLSSAGNAALGLGTPVFTVSGANQSSFTVTSASTNGCTSGESLAVGVSCALAATFSPVVTSGTLTENVALNSNGVNATSFSSTLIGTATNLSPTTTTVAQVSPTGNPAFGQAITISATVVSLRAGFTPTQNVTFSVDGAAVQTVALTTSSPYTASYTIPSLSLSAGPHTVTATYNGDTNNATSASNTLNITINQEASTTALSVYPFVSQPAGSKFTFTVQVSPTTVGTPTGSVILVAAGTTTMLQKTTISSSGAATFSIVAQSGGQYQVIYAGDTNFVGSTSNTIGIIVGPPMYTLSFSGTNINVPQGGSAALAVTVTSISGYTGSVAVGSINLTTGVSTPPCVGLPAYATCSFAPGVVSFATSTYPAANGTGVITLTINTNVPPVVPFPLAGFISWPAGIAVLLAAMLMGKRRTLMPARLLIAFAGFGMLMLSLSGCGSNTAYVTPKGTSTVMVNFTGSPVTGTPTTANPDINQTVAIQLTVQ